MITLQSKQGDLVLIVRKRPLLAKIDIHQIFEICVEKLSFLLRKSETNDKCVQKYDITSNFNQYDDILWLYCMTVTGFFYSFEKA